MAPTKQKAVVITENGPTLCLADVPKPGPGQILVEVVAAAQNPTDWKTLRSALKAGEYGDILGNDFAGTVVELGPDVPAGVRTVGEPVCGFKTCDVVSPNGSFSEYVVAESERGIIPMPKGSSFERASQLGIAPFTALQCLHQSLELPSPFDTPSGSQHTILVWGGASSVGQYAIQFAKLLGFRVITTALPENFNLLKNLGWYEDLGADEVFGYRDADVVEKIRAYTGNALEIAIDTISEGKTPKRVTSAIGDKGGRVATILPYESPRPDVEVKLSRFTDLLKRESNGEWYVDLLTKILATGKVQLNPLHRPRGGLAGVKEGFQYMQEGRVGAHKITYSIWGDTPKDILLDTV